MKTAKGLVEYVKVQLGLPYWYGTYGQTGTAALYASKKKQYPQYYNWVGTPYDNFPSQYEKRVHDCVGLIKGYLWSETPTSTPKYDGDQDKSANDMRSVCKEQGDIGTMPDVPGVLVFMNGHVGVYIGDGYVIEARGHEYGVVKTALKSRPWKWWGKCPYITYSNETTSAETDTTIESTNKAIKIDCKRITLKPGNWNIRKLPSTDSAVVTVVKGASEVNVATGWVYVPSCGGFVSEKAISQQ